jgi:hypothetical protein
MKSASISEGSGVNGFQVFWFFRWILDCFWRNISRMHFRDHLVRYLTLPSYKSQYYSVGWLHEAASVNGFAWGRCVTRV